MNLEMVSIILCIVVVVSFGLGLFLDVTLNEVKGKIVGRLFMFVGLIGMFGGMGIAFYGLLGVGLDILCWIIIAICALVVLFCLFMIFVLIVALCCCNEEKKDNSYCEFESERCCEEKCSGIHSSGGDSENASDNENDKLMDLYRKGKISKSELIELLEYEDGRR